MPDQEIVDLLVCGPFTGIDTRTATIYADPKTATQLSNTDTHRLEGALCTALGREAFLLFNNLEHPLAQIATYTVSQGRILYIAQDNSGNVAYYDSFTDEYGTLGNLALFTQAIQSNGVLWMNNGHQIFFGSNDLPNIARWHYPMPTTGQYGYSATASLAVPPLPPGIYSYAFVQKIEHDNLDSSTFQFTTPNGDIATGQRDDGSSIFPFDVENNGGNRAVALNGQFTGTTSDGYNFTTEVFRYSTNSPAWFLLTTLKTNATYYDNAKDASIAGNQQIIANQDQPPTGFGVNNAPIEAHQDALWCCAIINNKGTSFLPQTQLWYSRPGLPWSFDAIDQTLLIEDEETTLGTGNAGQTGVPFGDFPSALSAIGSSLLVLRRQTASLVYGVDEATYQALKIFADLGCIAPNSLIKGNGLTWWLSAQGFYGFDGSNVQWISKAIYNLLQSIPPASLQNVIGSYADLTCFWAIPGEGITLRYYIPTQAWEVLPYDTPSMVFATALSSDLTSTPLKMNQIAAARTGGLEIDFWQAADTDLGDPVVGTFTSQEGNTSVTEWEKIYKQVLVQAPIQPGVTVDITLTIDEAFYYTWSGVNLGIGKPTKVFNVPNNQGPNTAFPQGASNRGYTCQLQLTLHNAANATGPAVIYQAKVGGTMSRAWIIRSADSGSAETPPANVIPR